MAILTLWGPQGPVAVVDDLVGEKGVFATVQDCENQKVSELGTVQEKIKTLGIPVYVLDITCFDISTLVHSQSE